MNKRPQTRRELLEYLKPHLEPMKWPQYPKRFANNLSVLSDTKCPVLLVDVSSIAYHIFYTQCAGTKASKDEVAQIVQIGLLKKLLWLASTMGTHKILLCWDSKRSLRKKIFPLYKSKRRSSLDATEQAKVLEMKKALSFFRRKLAPRLGFNCLFQRGYESDDMIAVMTRTYQHIEFIIVANDADLFQLLRFNVQVLNVLMSTLIGVRDFMAKYKVPPATVIAAKCISGCPSDGVPGVGGIGEKRMTEFLVGTLSRDKVQVILDKWNIIKRNERLVRLPYEGVKLPRLHKCSLNLDGFKWVCDYLGIQNLSYKKGRDVNVIFKRVHRD